MNTMPTDGVKIIIADKNPQNGMRLQALLPPGIQCVGVATDYESAFRLMEQHRPQIVLMHINMALVMVNNKFPHSFLVIAIADEARPEFLRLGIDIKARDLLILPIGAAQLQESILKTLRACEREKQLALSSSVSAPAPSLPCQSITVISSKGGIGQSALIANLGLALSQEKRQTLIVDAIAQMGVQALMLDVPAIHTLDDLLGRGESLAADEMNQAVLNHKSGLRLLAAPMGSESMGPEELAHVIDQFKTNFQNIIFDLPKFHTSFSRALMSTADTILVLLSFNIPSIRNASMALSILNDLGVSKEQIRLIGTDFQSSGDLTKKDVAMHLKCELHYHLPLAGEGLLTSINTGEPMVLTEPHAPYSQAIYAMARDLIVGKDPLARPAGQPSASNSLQQKLQSRGWF
jgi:pilus assembly protein CpaE